MSHADLAAALARLADKVSLLGGRGDRFYVERHAIERSLRELAEEVARIDPERRRRAFQTGTIAVKSRIIPVSARGRRLSGSSRGSASRG